jgi:hypothetical protein
MLCFNVLYFGSSCNQLIVLHNAPVDTLSLTVARRIAEFTTSYCTNEILIQTRLHPPIEIIGNAQLDLIEMNGTGALSV